jgi:hypothetical protein
MRNMCVLQLIMVEAHPSPEPRVRVALAGNASANVVAFESVRWRQRSCMNSTLNSKKHSYIKKLISNCTWMFSRQLMQALEQPRQQLAPLHPRHASLPQSILVYDMTTSHCGRLAAAETPFLPRALRTLQTARCLEQPAEHSQHTRAGEQHE